MSTQETAKTLYLEVNGIKFAYRLIGAATPSAADTPPLLLLNHFRSNIDLWDPLIVNDLARTRQIITYDYAGLGHSGGEVRLSIRDFAADVASFLRALLPTLTTSTGGPIAAVDALGFSMGGYVVQQLAIYEPSLVRKLVLSGTGPSGSVGERTRRPLAEVQSAIMGDPPSGDAIADAFFPSFVDPDRTLGHAWFGRIMAGRAQVAGKEGEPEVEFFLSGPALARLTEAYLLWNADAVPYALLQSVQKDALVTAGSNDFIVPTEESYALSRQLPRANFVVYPTSGHGHLFQYSGIFSRHVREFLDGEWPIALASSGSIATRGF